MCTDKYAQTHSRSIVSQRLSGPAPDWAPSPTTITTIVNIPQYVFTQGFQNPGNKMGWKGKKGWKNEGMHLTSVGQWKPSVLVIILLRFVRLKYHCICTCIFICHRLMWFGISCWNSLSWDAPPPQKKNKCMLKKLNSGLFLNYTASLVLMKYNFLIGSWLPTAQYREENETRLC